MSNIKHIVAVDPGDVNNGFAYFKYDPSSRTADTRIMKICDLEEMSDLLKVLYEANTNWLKNSEEKKHNPGNFFFVIENFRVDTKSRGAIFQWNEMLTSQMIGAVKLCARWMDAPVFMQEPAILGMARKWAPFPLTKHIADEKSAWLHGAHWMISKKLVDNVDQITLFGQERL